MTQLAGHPGRAAHDLAAFHHAAAQAGPDDERHRGALGGVGAEVRVMGVQGGRVRVVVVDHRQPDPGLHRAADVEPAPVRVGEVHRAAGRDHPGRAGRPRRVQADAEHRFPVQAGERQDVLERFGQGLDRDGRAFPHPAGRLHQPVDQEPSRRVQHRRVIGRAAIVQADHDLLPLLHLASSFGWSVPGGPGCVASPPRHCLVPPLPGPGSAAPAASLARHRPRGTAGAGPLRRYRPDRPGSRGRAAPPYWPGWRGRAAPPYWPG
jgi:hypothetical protein